MVTEFGMSEKLGSVRYAGQRLQYLGAASDEGSDNSGETRETIDAEVRRLVGEQFARAEALLAANRDVLSRLAADLLKAESLDGSAVREALARAGHAAAEDTSRSAGAAAEPAAAPRPSGATGSARSASTADQKTTTAA
jgi:cell division protease FtsH